MPLALSAILLAVTASGCSEDSWFGALLGCDIDEDCGRFMVCEEGICTSDGATDSGRDTGFGADAADTSGSDTGADTDRADTDRVDTGGVDTGSDSGPVEDPLWVEFGTTGSVTGLVNTQAHCDSRSVRTDDLAAPRSVTLGPAPWGTSTIEDATGFCGTEEETLGWRLVNCERITRDLEPLRCDLRLVETSRQHSADMIARGYFDHADPQGNGPADRANANSVSGWSSIGENITTYPGAEAAHLSWMESPGHRANILTADYRWFGQGEALTGTGRPYTTQLFARFFGD